MKKSKMSGISELKPLLSYIKENVFMLSLGFLFIFIQNFGLVRIPLLMKKMLDEIVGLNRIEIITDLSIRILVFTSIVAVSLYLMRKIIIGISRKIEYRIRNKLFSKLMSFEYDFFLKNETGDLSSRLTNDLNDVRTLLGPGIMYIPNSVSRIIIFLPVLAALNFSLIIKIIPFFIILVALILKIIPALRPKFKKIQETTAEINNMVWQTVSGISLIKQNTLEKIETERFGNLNRLYINVQMAMVKLRSVIRPLFIFLFSIIEIVILYFGGKSVIAGTMSIGELLQFNIMVSALTFPILSLGWIMSMFQLGISAMGRINMIIKRDSLVPHGKKELKGKFDGIETKQLDFKYPGNEKKTLKNISLNVKKGSVIGITGPVGSGKSTLLDIISGLLIVDEGQVFFNGMDMKNIRNGSVAGSLSVVPQNPFLFSGTVKENIGISLVNPDTDTVKRAAEVASVEKEIESFPEGYDQLIGERGISLSGGQRQRIAIARAVCKPSQLLLLDDPLSSVDSETESRIIQNLKMLSNGAGSDFETVILVSHRISALKNCDRIYVLDSGSFTESGTHKELIKNRKYYYRMSEIQKLAE